MRWDRLIWLLAGLVFLALILSLGKRVAAHFDFSVSGQPELANVLVPGSRPGEYRLARESELTVPLTNTPESAARLAALPTAILLENALLDTSRPLDLHLPASLRSKSPGGAYIVQSRGIPDARFRAVLQHAGATLVSYVPNNAYLVRASAETLSSVSTNPLVQAVVAYEPFFKLKPSLLKLALTAGKDSVSGELDAGLHAEPLLTIRVLLFRDVASNAWSAVRDRCASVLNEQPSPFGRCLTVRAPASALAGLARLDFVQELEPAGARVPANDLVNARLGVSGNPLAADNYLGLTGSNVLVAVNDTGIDTNHPDLYGRIDVDAPASGLDSKGHGTHVAGIIAGNGLRSSLVTNAPGSALPAMDSQFRGKAPAARLLSLKVGDDPGGPAGDAYLQQVAAQSGAFICNNSWHYDSGPDYDLPAAMYDAAVRDALPGVSGSQPLMIVFAAGNRGSGNDDGSGGVPGTIQSPATAKNVLTVGAAEQARFITNETWTCSTNADPVCHTNTPWLGLTDSTNQVASFSSRGNVGLGLEGECGRFKPDVVAPGTFVISARSTQWDQGAYYESTNLPPGFQTDSNYFEVLSNLNQSLSARPDWPYRYESGSSMAAAAVSGTLALMQEFFEQRLGRTNGSPALMKALLINGARSLGAGYDFALRRATNSQGWGMVQLPCSLPPGLTNSGPDVPMVAVDQQPTNALATGQSKTWFVSVSEAARQQPLRVTLVWTDPPANPLAGLKLVNDLDLVVTNLDTGEAFIGNDIRAGALWNSPWTAGGSPADFVNNTENVFLSSALGTNYSVTVQARRVAVNAVSAQPEQVAQDFALVISSGDGQLSDALRVIDSALRDAGAGPVVSLENTFTNSPGQCGTVLLRERAGANAPLLGTGSVPSPGPGAGQLTLGVTNQWRFFALTNELGYTNAAFLTFLARSESLQGLGLTNAGSNTVASREADIDLYVSMDPALTWLDPAAVSVADKSVSRSGTETVIYSNAAPGVYYVGVKCETQLGTEFGLAACFSELPFAETDAEGNQLLRGFPAPAVIPGGTAQAADEAFVFCVSPDPTPIRRVIVTNVLTHPGLEDLSLSLSHAGASAALLNHSLAGAAVQQGIVYATAGEGDPLGAMPATGPGSLRDFAGKMGSGQWRLTLSSTNRPGTNDGLTLFLEPQPDLAGAPAVNVLPRAYREEFVFVPANATNLTLQPWVSSPEGVVLVEIGPAQGPTNAWCSLLLTPSAINRALTLTRSGYPSLSTGLYVVRVSNLSSNPVTVNPLTTLGLDLAPAASLVYTSGGVVPLLDDAATLSTLMVHDAGEVVSAAVNLRIAHPRVSDLVVSLVSPSGTPVLLSENRGGFSSAGFGQDIVVTNISPVWSSGGPLAVTNVIDTGQTSGTVRISYDFFDKPDEMRVYYQGALIYDSGLVSDTGQTNLAYGPGTSTALTIIMNEGDNYDPDTFWTYTVTSTSIRPGYITFSGDTNATLTPIKFAAPPFTNGVFLSEARLDKLAGEPALGPWTLQVLDTRAGGSDPPPSILSWQLVLNLQQSNAPPRVVTLTNGVPFSQTNQGLAGPEDYFRFVVSTNAVRAQFELNKPGADFTLVARRGLPLPNLSLFDLLSANPATNDELMVAYDFSAPIPLVPGEWYLTAVNLSGNPASYSIRASESAVYGTNNEIVVQSQAGDSFCLTWNSLPGAHYYIQAAPDVSSPNWGSFPFDIVATNTLTTFCVPAQGSSMFWRVQEGLILHPPPLLVSQISMSGQGLILEWPCSYLGIKFQVEWSAALADWNRFTNVIVSTNGPCYFLDDGTQSGGLGGSRYYRLLQLP